MGDEYDPYDVYVPGKLKLKKIAVDKTIKKKKRKTKPKKEPLASREDLEDDLVVPADTRTEMEKRVQRTKEEREKQKIRALASKSYRERVEDFNQHLDTLTEHYDIPKVGPG